MKLKKIKIKFKRLFELQLIKSKIYEQPIEKNISENLPDTNLTQTILNFKKALHVIFKYHKNSKRILFLGVPKNIELTLNQKTSHTAISTTYQIRKFKLNQTIQSSLKFSTQTSIKSKKETLLTRIKSRPDLIVNFNESDTRYKSILQEGYTSRIPIIQFSNSIQERYWKYCYSVPGNIESTSNKHVNNIFFILVNAMLKNTKPAHVLKNVKNGSYSKKKA
jgi:ribosomal protein S2